MTLGPGNQIGAERQTARERSNNWGSIAPAINRLLAAYSADLTGSGDRSWPIVHVVGVPRSGTTLATQLLISGLNVGYIDNIVAAFWEAPAVGVALSRHILNEPRTASFSSEFGRTPIPEDPHEFGYFWRDILGYRSLEFGDRIDTPINWSGVGTAVGQIANAWGAPLVLKSFLGAWHLREFASVMPDTFVVRVRRPLAESAVSLLRMRYQIHGNPRSWTSVRPPIPFSTDDLNPHAQVAAQAFFTDRMIGREIAELPGNNVLNIDYGLMTREPRRVVSWVAERLKEAGLSASPRTWTPPLLSEKVPSTESIDFQQISEELDRLVQKYGHE